MLALITPDVPFDAVITVALAVIWALVLTMLCLGCAAMLHHFWHPPEIGSEWDHVKDASALHDAPITEDDTFNPPSSHV